MPPYQTLNLTLTGPVGALEACLSSPDSSAQPTTQGLAVLCHPHPQYGGSMHDSVLGTVEQSLLAAGWAVLRFNFRGVGASAGQFDNGAGEQQDLLAVLSARDTDIELAAALSPQQRSDPILLCGYSFGAAMAWQAHQQKPHSLAALWLVAPPLSVMPLAATAPSPAQLPLLVVLGTEDAFCALPVAQQWLGDLDLADKLHLIDGADHFFGGQHAALRACTDALLDHSDPS